MQWIFARMGLFIDHYRRLNRIHHNGEWVGYRAALSRFPDHTSRHADLQLRRQYVENVSSIAELVFIQVFLGNVVLWQLMRVHFSLIRVIRFLNARNSSSLKQISFLHQFVNAFGVCLLRSRQSFKIFGLSRGCFACGSQGPLLKFAFELIFRTHGRRLPTAPDPWS